MYRKCGTKIGVVKSVLVRNTIFCFSYLWIFFSRVMILVVFFSIIVMMNIFSTLLVCNDGYLMLKYFLGVNYQYVVP